MKTSYKEKSQGNSQKTVKDCMTKNAEYIKPESTLKEAANKMATLDTGSLPVGNGEKLLGFITDRDIAIRAVAKGLDPETTKVEEIMTNKVLYCYENQSLEEVADNMKENHILRLIVLDAGKKFKGVITHSDLSKSLDTPHSDLCVKIADLASFKDAA